MTRQRLAQALTILLAGATVVFLMARRETAVPAAGSSPQDAVYAMLDAARQGDVRSYLQTTTGSLRRSLEQSLAESGEGAFGGYLRESNSRIKGIAITEPEPVSDSEVKLRIEYVYADRNEVQIAWAVRDGKVWRVARLDASERIRTPVPYGTPVDATAPE